MIHGDDHPKRLLSVSKGSGDWGDNPFVKVFDGLNLVIESALVAGLVGGFQMDKDEILLFERFDGGSRFAFVIGIDIPGSALDLGNVESDTDTKPIQQVDR